MFKLSPMFNTIFQYVESARIRNFSRPCFPVFGLNTKIYTVNLRIQSECGKVRTRKFPNKNTFYAVFYIDKKLIFLLEKVTICMAVFSNIMCCYNDYNVFITLQKIRNNEGRRNTRGVVYVWAALHQKMNFSLRISSINVTKAAVSCGFGHIDWFTA